MKRPYLVLGTGFLCAVFSTHALAEVEHSGSADYTPFAGTDLVANVNLKGNERHVTLLTKPSDPSSMWVVSLDAITNKPVITPAIVCSGRLREAYWQTTTPSTLHRAYLVWGNEFPVATAVVARDQRTPFIRLIFGCK